MTESTSPAAGKFGPSFFRRSALFFLALILFNISYAQESSVHSYPASRSVNPVILDGKDNDPAWAQAQWADGFTQYEPYEGRQPTRQTAFKIAYDDNNFYALVRCFDHPDSIQTRLTRKDDMDGDLAALQIDSYFDHRTAFVFMVSAAGVKTDYIISEDGQKEDYTWDPIWYVKTTIDADGWMAEIRIPLSQLRFGSQSEQIWGLQVVRYLYRKQELSLWQPVPRDASGWVRRFGRLEGINHIKPRRQIEIAPYVVASAETYPAEKDNPFSKGKDYRGKFGVDGKIGLTNNMIMDLTINPDFGQVEADPSEVNLTAYETYFVEKRPFFIEGKNIFDFPVIADEGSSSEENLFYSRRIGRPPQRKLELSYDMYASVPDYTKILGAAKITGKTANGLSLGILESVTSEEYAEVDSSGIRRKEPVEPLTNYFVARLQKDSDRGNLIWGGMFTAVNRNTDHPALSFLPSAAYSGGADVTRYWKNKEYYVKGRILFSHIRGSADAMLGVQTSSTHYFQRPDMDYVRFDSTRTSLAGIAGRFEIGKEGGGHWRWSGTLTWKSPGFDVNDAGYVQLTDLIDETIWVSYRIWEPFSFFRKLSLNASQYSEFDFGGNNVVNGINFNLSTQLKNYWNLYAGITLQSPTRANYFLRGGPAFLVPPSVNSWLQIATDQRKKFYVTFQDVNRFGGNHWLRQYDMSMAFTFRPSDVIMVSAIPAYTSNQRELQYVTHKILAAGDRYVFSSVSQQILRMSVRLNLSFTPNLSLQFWGQPFLAAVNYSRFKQITNPLAKDYNNRFRLYDEHSEISFSGGYYLVDENRDGNTDFQFYNPDFNLNEFKSNLVFRWEYTPGSTLYLVWSHYREYNTGSGKWDFRGNAGNLFSVMPHNVWLIKFSYRFRN